MELARLNKKLGVMEKELHVLIALNYLHTGDYKYYHQLKIDDLEQKIMWVHDQIQSATMDIMGVTADEMDGGELM